MAVFGLQTLESLWKSSFLPLACSVFKLFQRMARLEFITSSIALAAL